MGDLLKIAHKAAGYVGRKFGMPPEELLGSAWVGASRANPEDPLMLERWQFQAALSRAFDEALVVNKLHRRHRETTINPEELDTLTSPRNEVDHLLLTVDRFSLETAKNHLKGVQKTIIEHLLDGKSLQDASETLGMSLRTVQRRYKKALSRMKVLLS